MPCGYPHDGAGTGDVNPLELRGLPTHSRYTWGYSPRSLHHGGGIATVTQTRPVDWDELKHSLHPEDFLGHVEELRKAYRQSWVREAYGHSMSEASALAEGLLCSDPNQRYGGWLKALTAAHHKLEELGVAGYAELCERLATREGAEAVSRRAVLGERELGGLLRKHGREILRLR